MTSRLISDRPRDDRLPHPNAAFSHFVVYPGINPSSRYLELVLIKAMVSATSAVFRRIREALRGGPLGCPVADSSMR